MADPDPFAVLGLAHRFDLAAADVERAYLVRSAQLHPDVAGGDDGAAAAADLNKARRDLKDPEARATVLLALLGGPTKEQDRTLPDGFLVEMMEVREQMEAGSAADRAKWEAWGEQRRTEHERAVGELFKRAAATHAPDPNLLKEIRKQLNAWRYVERMLEQVHPAGAGG